MAAPKTSTPPAAPAPAAAPAPSAEELDAAAARAIVAAAKAAVEAIESLRTRIKGKRDATAATGHLLVALDEAGGMLREYDRPHVFAIRHALGGESHGFTSPHDAAAQLLGVIVQALRPPRDENDKVRRQNARADLMALSRIFRASEHSIEATKALEQHDQGQILAKAQADKAAHDARLAAGARVMHARSAPTPAAPSQAAKARQPTKEPDAQGDYPLEGSVDAPGGDAFPTHPVG